MENRKLQTVYGIFKIGYRRNYGVINAYEPSKIKSNLDLASDVLFKTEEEAKEHLIDLPHFIPYTVLPVYVVM
jgi:hypothetical protein